MMWRIACCTDGPGQSPQHARQTAIIEFRALARLYEELST
jgi:hypothetical protein